MLHTETVGSGTLSLLKKLIVLPSLKPFSLVGGTALSLRYGHRSSVDIDLFFHKKFNHQQIIDELEETFQHRFVYEQQQTLFGIFSFIDDIKVDIVYFSTNRLQKLMCHKLGIWKTLLKYFCFL